MSYELRMSDWSSDVCSSDLKAGGASVYSTSTPDSTCSWFPSAFLVSTLPQTSAAGAPIPDMSMSLNAWRSHHSLIGLNGANGSEERRVGTECVITCRSRWSTSHHTNRILITSIDGLG